MISVAQIRKDLESFDYIKNDVGVDEKQLNNLKPEEAYLFIGIGGMSTWILHNLKSKLKKNIIGEDYKRVSFLAIDTDLSVEDEFLGFDESEILYLKGGDAVYNCTTPEMCPPEIREWIHPMHSSVIKRECSYGGFGTGCIRQASRMHLFYPRYFNLFHDKIMNLAKKVTADGAKKLNVYFLAGIAGGTGGGLLIDIGILTRYILSSGFPSLSYGNGGVNYRAFVLLPGNCGAKIIRGNENAYATLKELDYFMTIMDGDGRDEPYIIDYGVLKVTLENNIFDFCTLIDTTIGEADNRYYVASDYIVNVILNSIIFRDDFNYAYGDRKAEFLDCLLSGIDYRYRHLENMSQEIWPSEANYVYSLIGYSECVFPIGLINAYIMKKVCDHVYDIYWNHAKEIQPDTHDNNNDEIVDGFINKCGLKMMTILSSSTSEISANEKQLINSTIEHYACINGPWYMINLLNYANNRILNYIDEINNKKFIRFQKKKTLIEKYKNFLDYLSNLRINMFEVFILVLEQLRNVLENDSNILTDLDKYNDVFGNSCKWSLVDFTDNSSQQYYILKEYLDDKFSVERIERISNQFINHMIDKKEEWTGCSIDGQEIPKHFSPSKAILDFVQENISNVDDLNFEDIIARLFSFDEAKSEGVDIREINSTEKDNFGNEKSSKWLKNSSLLLMHELRERAQPLAHLNEAYEHNYKLSVVMIPQSCHHLRMEVNDTSVYSDAQVSCCYEDNKIIWYTIYCGIAPYMLDWTIEAEQDYEKEIDSRTVVGLHLCEAGENSGKNLPNLYPRTLWGKRMDYKESVREKKLADTIDSVLEDLKDKGLIKYDTFDLYSKYPWYIYLPKKTDYLNSESFFDLLDEEKQYKLDDFLDDSELFDKINIRFFHQKQGDFDDWFMAKCNVRKQLRLMNRILDSIPMINDFIKSIDIHNNIAKSFDLWKKRKNSFIKLLVLENISNDITEKYLFFDSRRRIWKLNIPDLSIDIKDENHLERKAQIIIKEYYAKCFIITIPEHIFEEIETYINNFIAGFSNDKYESFCLKKYYLKNHISDILNGEKRALYEFEYEEFIEELDYIEDGMARKIMRFYKELEREL